MRFVFLFIACIAFLEGNSQINTTDSLLRSLNKAKELLDNTKYSEAYNVLHPIADNPRWYKKDSLTAQFYYLYGTSLSRTRRYENAIDTLIIAETIILEVDGKQHPRMIETLIRLAVSHIGLQKNDLALQVLLKANDICTNFIEIPYYLKGNTLNGIGLVHLFTKKYELAEAYFKKAIAIFDDQPFHPYSVFPYKNLGDLYVSQRKYEFAIVQYQKVIDIKEQLLPESISLADAYNNLGNCYEDLGDFNTFIYYQKKSLTLLLKNKAENEIKTAYIYSNLAYAAWASGQDEWQGINYAKKAIFIFRNNGLELSQSCGLAYNHLANCYSNLREYEKALTCHFKALDIRSKVLDETHIDVGATYTNIGNQYMFRQEYHKALEYYKKHFDIRLEHYEYHPYTGLSCIQMGWVHQNLEEYEKALLYFMKAIEIFSSPKVKGHYQEYVAYDYIGSYYKELKVYSKALYYYRTALEKVKQLTRGRASKADRYISLANVYMEMNSFSEAKSHIDSAFNALGKDRSFSNLYTFQEKKQLLVNLNTEANLLKKQYSFFSNKAYLDRLQKNRQETMQMIEALMPQFSERSSRSNWLRDNLSTFEQLIWVENRLATKDNNTLEELFQYSEKSKAYILLENFHDAVARNTVNIPDSLIDIVTEFEWKLTQFEKEIFEEGSKENENREKLNQLNAQIYDHKQAFDSLQNYIESAYPKYYQLKYNFDVTSVRKLQDKMPSNQTLLEYFVGDSTIFAFLIQKEHYSVHEIAKDFPLDEWVDTLRNSIYDYYLLPDQSPTKYAAANQQYVETAYQLYQKLIAPLENQLTEQLIIVPDGVLGYLPFDVLLKEKPQKADDFRNHHYLLKDYQISYAYSATLLQEMQDKKHHPTKRLLAFAPSFNGDAIASRNIQDIRRALGNLKYNIPEAEQIHSLMGGDIYKGLEATEPLFWDIASQYQILHLSTHGKADDRVGDYSFLAFSEIPDSIENEKLYVRDLYNLQLNADMVVLSACETGIGELQRGEGILSLARGFAYAGAKSIINTLWSVNDESTQYLMKRFYTHLKAGQPKDAALRQAKLDYIQNGQQADPFFWAAFIPIGDMAPLEFSYAFPIWLLGGIIGLMGIIVILYLRSSKR